MRSSVGIQQSRLGQRSAGFSLTATLTVDAHWLVRGRAAFEDESGGRQWAPLATVDHWHVMKLCIEGSLDRVGIQ